METYECTVGLGWGIAGPTLFGIKRKAREIGVQLAPFPWARMDELVKQYTIQASGEDEAVRKFAEYCKTMGYDGRTASVGMEEASREVSD